MRHYNLLCVHCSLCSAYELGSAMHLHTYVCTTFIGENETEKNNERGKNEWNWSKKGCRFFLAKIQERIFYFFWKSQLDETKLKSDSERGGKCIYLLGLSVARKLNDKKNALKNARAEWNCVSCFRFDW